MPIKKKVKKEYSYKDKLKSMIGAKDRRMIIISTYWQFKRFNFDNNDQYTAALKRELRPAAALKGYGVARILETMKYLDTKDFKWTLETVHKYIDEDFNSLSGEQPILIIKTGEKIYDIKRLQQLEREGHIFYKNNKWQENR